MLSVREHSCRELTEKLGSKGIPTKDVTVAINQLRDDNLQSDERFTEAYIHSRQQRGYGPLWIKQALREQKGISDTLINTYIQENDPQWLPLACKTREKKYGNDIPTNYQDEMRQCQFLQYRGFSSEQIRQIFKTDQT